MAIIYSYPKWGGGGIMVLINNIFTLFGHPINMHCQKMQCMNNNFFLLKKGPWRYTDKSFTKIRE